MKKIFLLLFLLPGFFAKAQTTQYQIGKYKATIDLTNFKMKWENGNSYSCLKEINSPEKNVRKFEEIEKGKVVGTFEIYYITDGEHDGLYIREKDKMEFEMSVLKVIKKVSGN